MALTPRCRAGGGENLCEELAAEDEGANGSNFEPLSDSCGESDMEGLDLSLFEPQADAASWCDSRIHAGTLHILVNYCGKLMLLHGIDIYYISLPFGNSDLFAGQHFPATSFRLTLCSELYYHNSHFVLFIISFTISYQK